MSPDRALCLALLILGLIAEPFAGNSEEPRRVRHPESKVTWNLRELENSLGKYRHRKVAFRETHVSTLLSEPLKLSGTLTFTAPSRLEKHVTSPYEERYLVDENQVSFENLETGVSRSLSLDDFPALRGFVDGLRAAFTGDLSTLERFFHLSLDGGRNEWQLNLEPVHEVTRDAIDSIRITGKRDEVTAIEIRESSGDYSRIEIKAESG